METKRQKIKLIKGNVQETLFLPLWGRATETKTSNPRIVDNKAVEIIDKLDYDFSTITANFNEVSITGWVARCLHIDRAVTKFIEKHPEATIINLGCGLDTTFDRVDNGKIMFYELDFPEVIELRKSFFQDTERHKSIASSFLEKEWYRKIGKPKGLLCIAGGVLYYSNEKQIKSFFISMADHFGQCDFFFDSLSPMGMKVAKKQVLKKGGMGMSQDGGWGLKSIKSLEKWDKRLKVVRAIPMYKGMKKGLPFSTKFILSMPDILGVCHMVYVRMEEKQMK
jgi:O-methyltransferase involved in polyketide biosynthesis